MTVCFNKNIYIQTFDDSNIYPPKKRKCKDFDGPNNFSILWNQLLILLHNNIINDKYTLYNRFNPKILNIYQKEILNEIDNILYKFTILDIYSVTLYYNTYTIKNEKHMIHKLLNLYDLIHN